MKKALFFTLTLLLSLNASAHFMWVETNPTAKLNQKHEVKVFFGEYTYGVQEKVSGEAFEKMKHFEVWAISPSGEKTKLEMTPGELFYTGWFSPKSNGTYTIALNNNKIDVIDYTQYDFGIFKTHYHSTAKVLVGNSSQKTAAVNPEGITLVDVTAKDHKENNEAVFQVLYKGQPLKEKEVTVFISDLWSKKVYTDEKGEIKFSLPWKTKYIMEVTHKEEVPGKYNNEDYQFVWHCATYAILLDKA